MRTALAAHPPWRQLLIITIALPLLIVLAVLAYAWPAARIAPRDLPIGIVGTGPAAQRAVSGLTHAEPGAFDLHLYADEPAARAAIADRDVYGAFVVEPGGITVLEASAASPTVASLLSTVGQRVAAAAPAAPPVHHREDVVATSKEDPKGLVLSSALLPLTICSVLIAAAIGLLMRFGAAWRALLALVVVTSVSALGAYLIAQGFLGALPHQPVATWAALALTLLAVSATTAGLMSLIGPAGLGLGAALMVFVGNPFSGAGSAPELLPGAARHLGQWLPPGAGANLLRSTAYFDGNGASGHVIVLAVWAVCGLAAVALRGRLSLRAASGAGEPTAVNPALHAAR